MRNVFSETANKDRIRSALPTGGQFVITEQRDAGSGSEQSTCIIHTQRLPCFDVNRLTVTVKTGTRTQVAFTAMLSSRRTCRFPTPFSFLPVYSRFLETYQFADRVECNLCRHLSGLNRLTVEQLGSLSCKLFDAACTCA